MDSIRCYSVFYCNPTGSWLAVVSVAQTRFRHDSDTMAHENSEISGNQRISTNAQKLRKVKENEGNEAFGTQRIDPSN